MTKQSQALFLAQKMGLDSPRLYQPNSALDVRVLVSATVFDPHTNKAQWAEVVLWAVQNRIASGFFVNRVEVCDRSTDGTSMWRVQVELHDNTDAGIMAATLEATCRAMGWEE